MLLDPRSLVANLRLKLIGPTRAAGRDAVGLHGTPRGELQYPISNATDVDLVVDVERGVLLRLVASSAGEPFHVQEMLSASFDEVLPDRLFEPPEGEVFLPVPEGRVVSIEESSGLVPFTVLVPATVPDDWSDLHVSYWQGWGRPPHWGPTLSLIYNVTLPNRQA